MGVPQHFFVEKKRDAVIGAPALLLLDVLLETWLCSGDAERRLVLRAPLGLRTCSPAAAVVGCEEAGGILVPDRVRRMVVPPFAQVVCQLGDCTHHLAGGERRFQLSLSHRGCLGHAGPGGPGGTRGGKRVDSHAP
eukprot:scaffold108774_cov27-Tisochrysis_lutea.AAC.2